MKPEQKFSIEFRDAVRHTYAPWEATAFRLETSHTAPGLPDWVVFVKPGRAIFVELKIAPARATPAQKVMHRLLILLQIELVILIKTINGVIINDEGPFRLEDCINKIVEGTYNGSFTEIK